MSGGEPWEDGPRLSYSPSPVPAGARPRAGEERRGVALQVDLNDPGEFWKDHRQGWVHSGNPSVQAWGGRRRNECRVGHLRPRNPLLGGRLLGKGPVPGRIGRVVPGRWDSGHIQGKAAGPSLPWRPGALCRGSQERGPCGHFLSPATRRTRARVYREGQTKGMEETLPRGYGSRPGCAGGRWGGAETQPSGKRDHRPHLSPKEEAPRSEKRGPSPRRKRKWPSGELHRASGGADR